MQKSSYVHVPEKVWKLENISEKNANIYHWVMIKTKNGLRVPVYIKEVPYLDLTLINHSLYTFVL